MAEVFAARLRGEAGFTRFVALKRMHPHLAEDPAFVEMFLDEARLAAHVRGAHVVPTIDLGRDEAGAPFLVMDLVIGVTLWELVRASLAREGPLPMAMALEILADAAEGLEEAHSARAADGTPLGVVHRDVSPQNILVGADGRARVADFGVARALLRSTHTDGGELKGKYAYFSPEQSHAGAVDARSDVFSMGIVCWEALAGRRLFGGDDPLSCIEQVRSMPVPPIGSVRPGLPELAQEAVARALERDLDRRTPRAGELAAALRRAAAEAGSRGAAGVAWLVSELAPKAIDDIEAMLRRSATVDPETSTAVDVYLAESLPKTQIRPAGATPTAGARAEPSLPSTRVGHGPPPEPSAAPHPERPPTHAPGRRSRIALVLAFVALLLGGAALVAVIATRAAESDEAGPAGNGRERERESPTGHVADEPIPLPLHPPSSRPLLRAGTRALVDLEWVGLPPAIAWRLGHELGDGTEAPVYVARMPSTDNGDARLLPDGRFEVTWRLREGARWSDGQPLVADDVVLGYRVDPPLHFEGARAASSAVVVATWREPLESATRSPLPVPHHALGALFDTEGAAAVEARRRDTVVPTLGPYRVARWSAGERVELERNPHFPGPPPSIERIVVTRDSDWEALASRVERGELDLLFPNSILLDQARALRERRPDLVYIRPSAIMVFLQPDLSVAPFDRLDVRRALLMAIDRERLARQTYGTEGRVAHAPSISPPADIDQYPHDPESARELLEGQGVIGTEIAVLVAPDVGHHMAELVADDLRAVGLRAVVREVEEHAAYRGGHHGGLLMYAVETPSDEVIDDFWGLPRRGGEVDTSARNAAFDDATAAVLDRVSFAESPERASEYRASLVRAYARRLPQLPLVFAAERVVADPALRGWDVPPGRAFGWGIEGWYFSR